MVWNIAIPTAVAAVGSLIGANEADDAANDAERAQTAAANRALDIQEDQYADQRQLFMPYWGAGMAGLYGSGGVLDLLGHSQPGGAPQNAFSQGGGGFQAPLSPQQQRDAEAQAHTNQYQAYLDANPDLMQHYTSANIAMSPHLLGGGGRGADKDGDGRISPIEFGEYHYTNHGRAEGRELPSAQPQNAFAGGGTTPNIVPDGNGGYRQGGDQNPLAVAGPATTQPVGKEVDSGVSPQTAALRQSPGYQFLLDESARGIENSFASRGKLLSGAAMDALNTRTLGLADQTYQSSLNNQFQLANLGMGAAAQTSNAGSNYANAASNAFTQIGNAQANGAYGRSNAFNNGLQGASDAIFGGLGIYGSQQGWF